MLCLMSGGSPIQHARTFKFSGEQQLGSSCCSSVPLVRARGVSFEMARGQMTALVLPMDQSETYMKRCVPDVFKQGWRIWQREKYNCKPSFSPLRSSRQGLTWLRASVVGFTDTRSMQVGEISVDKVKLCEWNTSSLHSQMALATGFISRIKYGMHLSVVLEVAQQPLLFDTSIRNNLTYGCRRRAAAQEE